MQDEPRPPVANNECVNRVRMRVPPFWPADPEMWFHQLESHFRLTGITVDETKYATVVANLEATYIQEVRDIILQPPDTNKYVALKEALTTRLGTTQTQKVQQLLKDEELGDRKPSQYLRHLQSLAGTTVPDMLLRTIWMHRLPVPVQAILATQSHLDLGSVA